MQLTFQQVTPENWRMINTLRVKEEQESFVAPNVTILARAYAYRTYNSIVYAIYDGETPVGLLMQRDYEQSGKLHCVLDQFMIDRNAQGKGYGKKAMQMWLAQIERQQHYHSVILCYKEQDVIAYALYKGLGFVHTGEVDEDEVEMCYVFTG